MAIKNIREAINETLHLEMARDPSVIVLGEDVSGGAGTPSVLRREAIGGIWGTFGEADAEVRRRARDRYTNFGVGYCRRRGRCKSRRQARGG